MKTNATITETATKYNMTEFQKRQLNETTFEKLIDWGFQRQITWGIVFLTTLTVFFPILLEIYSRQKIGSYYYDDFDSDKLPARALNWFKNDVSFLDILAIFFLILACISIFQLAHYYRYVACAEQWLSSIAIKPTNWIYSFVLDWWVEKGMIIFFFVIFLGAIIFKYGESAKLKLSKKWKVEKKHMARTASQVLFFW